MSATDQIPPEGERDEIARLEVRIETLSESLERCRKVSLAAQLVLGAGAMWIVLLVLRVAPFAPFHVVGAISAIIGGIVLFGSNASTRKQIEAARTQAEALRADLIDRINPRIVTEEADGGASDDRRFLALRGDSTMH